MKFKELLVSSSLVLFSLSINAQVQEFNLKYDLKEGKSFEVKNRSYCIDKKVYSDSSKVYYYSITNMLLHLTVTDNNHNNGQRIEVKYVSKGFNTIWDSGRVDDEKLDTKNDLKMSFTLSANGQISDFGDYQTLENYLAENDAFSIDQLQEEIIHLFPYLPDNPIRIGESWIGEFSGEGDQESFFLTYTLLDEEKVGNIDCLKIIAKYTTSSDFPYEMKGKKYTVTTHSKGNDIYYFAYKKGFLLSRRSIGDGGLEIIDSRQELYQKRESDVLYETDITFD